MAVLRGRNERVRGAFGLCREAAEEAAEEKKKKKNDGGEASDGGEMVRSARAFLEVRRKVDLERRWIV